MRKVLSRTAYGLFVTLFVVAGCELMLRAVRLDPFYYWKFRFQFVSPNAYVNRAEGVWTYRPNADLREVAVYGMPSPLTREPKLWVEFDCRMRSNNLGLLQDSDLLPEKPATIVFGDSFTSGQGGCPWFHKLQARRPRDQLLNAGQIGTGFAQWWRMFEYLKSQGVVAERLLIIAISNDFKRKVWVWPKTDFDCLDRNICTWDGVYSWQPVGPDENHGELLARTRARYSMRFSNYSALSFWFLSLEQYSYFLKFLHIAVENIANLTRFVTGEVRHETEAALKAFKALGLPVKVLLVNQRDETGSLGNEADTAGAVAILKAHALPHGFCHLDHDDFLPIDGHPTAAGYDKLAACAEQALAGE